MKPDLPKWYPYDPTEPPPEIGLAPEASLIVLLATAGAESDGWAPRAAVSLAQAWAVGGRRVLLADLGLSSPHLHRLLGEPNGEGMSDALLFGASLSRIGRPHDAGFFFAPSGTPVVRGDRVLTSSRWHVVAQGFARASAQLLVYLPHSERGREALLDRADEIVVLAAPGETGLLAEITGNIEQRVVAVLWPAHRPGVETQGASAEPDEGSAPSFDGQGAA